MTDAGAPLPFDRGAIDAVSLDVGGVVVVPDHGLIGHALTVAGIAHDRSAFLDGHYRAMAEVDRSRAAPESFTDYNRAFVSAVGVPGDRVEAAAAVLDQVIVAPLWHQPLPGAREALARLAGAGVRLAVTSNSDGTVADGLRRYEMLQVGEGPGVAVEHISDSGLLGAHKPDPAIFRATAEGLGLPPDRICHIGDAGGFDADGAAAAGMWAVHVDPLGLCPRAHAHVASLADFADRLVGAGVAGPVAGAARPD
jgi:putative hydrolase of the HAD superfamily